MPKLSQAAALIFTLLLTVAAQAHESNKSQSAERLARLQRHLGLSDDQVSQMRDIRVTGGGREEVLEVLTDGQRSQLEEHRAQHRNRRGHRHWHRNPPDT